MPFSGGTYSLPFRFGTGTAPNNQFPPEVGADFDDIAGLINASGYIPVTGLVPDGVTDNTAAIQAALDQAYAATYSPALIFPPGVFLTHTLKWLGVDIFGSGSSSTTLKGYPGEDILRYPDLSAGESGAVSGFPFGSTISRIGFNLDDTQSLVLGPGGDFNRPVYPVLGTWSTGITVNDGNYYQNSVGKIYLAVSSGTTGATQPTHTAPTIRVSDGAVTWEWMADAQRYVGNACIALPVLNGNFGGVTNFPRNLLFDDVNFITNDQNAANGSCGIYCAKAFYGCTFRRLTFTQFAFGYANVPPTTNNNASTDFSADENLYDCVALFNTTSPFIAFNHSRCTTLNLQCYAASEGNKSVELVYFLSAIRGDTSKWTCINTFIEPFSTGTFELSRVQGGGHVFINGQLSTTGAPYIVWSADFCNVYQVFIGCDNLYMPGIANNFEHMWVRDLGPDRPLVTQSGTQLNNFVATRLNTDSSKPYDRVKRYITADGNPNGAVFGNIGDTYISRTGGAGTTFWVKESGTNTNTGWVGK